MCVLCMRRLPFTTHTHVVRLHARYAAIYWARVGSSHNGFSRKVMARVVSVQKLLDPFCKEVGRRAKSRQVKKVLQSPKRNEKTKRKASSI